MRVLCCQSLVSIYHKTCGKLSDSTDNSGKNRENKKVDITVLAHRVKTNLQALFQRGFLSCHRIYWSYLLRKINRCDHYIDMETKPYMDNLKTCLQTCICHPYHLHGDKGMRSLIPETCSVLFMFLPSTRIE